MARRSTPEAQGPAEPPSRTPVPVRTRRSLGDVLRAAGAALALAVLLLAVPVALAYVVGWPLPHSMPTMEMLKNEISAGVFIDVLAVVVWLAWAQFTACVLVEARAAFSGVGLPARVPGAGGSQMLARQLVAAALLLGSTAASFAPGLSQLGQTYHQPNQPQAAASAQQTPGAHPGVHHAEQQRRTVDGAGPSASTAESAAGTKPENPAKATKYYRIQPPNGRHHDSLWEVAERHLDDGRRYKEILRLNKDREQPDGSKLSEASLIRPGWIMEMPADAHGGELVEVPDEAPDVGKELRQQIEDYRGADGRDAGRAQPDSGQGQQAGGGDKERTPRYGDRERAESRVTDPQPAPGEVAGPEITSGEVGLPEALIGAPLLAAGLLAALGRRRRTALWQSAAGAAHRGVSVGTDFAPQTRRAGRARDALMVGADPEGVRLLDGALRGLSESLAAHDRTLPAVHAVWLTSEALHVQLVEHAGEPPAPWQFGQSQAFWTIARSQVRDAAEGGIAAPYPSLVSLGTRDDARLLLNLESAPGLVSVTGPEPLRRAVVTSVAAELVTNGWSDRMTVTLVGFGADLAEIAPTRVRCVENVPAMIEVMEAETQQRRNALGSAGQNTVLTGRTRRTSYQWAPHLVLIGSEPSEAEAEQLARLAVAAGPLGIGYLAASADEELPGAVWEFEITEDEILKAPLMGLELRAQLFPAEECASVVELFRETSAGPPGGEANRPVFKVDLSDQGQPAVYARLMGTYEIIGLGPAETGRSELLHEALALLLLHREGVHPRVLASALWPKGATKDVRDALIGRLGDWLGHDPDGSPRLGLDGDGRLKLSESVVSDLDVLRTLHLSAAGEAGAGLPAEERRRLLEDALKVARGPVLARRPEGRYGWLAHELAPVQQPLLVIEVGLALAAEYLGADRPDNALRVVRSALKTAPADERLWQEFLRAAHATGDEAQLSAAVDWVTGQSAQLHGRERGLPPQTQALVNELTPSRHEPGEASG